MGDAATRTRFGDLTMGGHKKAQLAISAWFRQLRVAELWRGDCRGFIAAQQEAGPNENDKAQRTKVGEDSRRKSREMSIRCRVEKEMQSLCRHRHNRVPAHRKDQAVTESPGTKRCLLAKRNRVDRQPRWEQDRESNPQRKAWD